MDANTTVALVATMTAAAGEGAAGGGLVSSVAIALVPALLAALLAYVRGVRFLGPLVAAVDWFRAHGAADLDLGGLGLSSEQQRQVRARTQQHLRDALARAIRIVMAEAGIGGAFAAFVARITEPLKAQADPANRGHRVLPSDIRETAAAAKQTTGIRVAFGAPPPRLGVLLAATAAAVIALLLACTGAGCVSAEATRAAEELAASARVLELGATHHDHYAALPPTRAATALEGYRRLTREHRAAVEELVRAAGGSLERVKEIEAERIRAAEARAGR